MRLWLLAAALFLTACARRAPDGAEVYRAADGSFSAAVPASWKVDETTRGTRRAAFYGPASGASPFSQVISVSFEDGSPETFLAMAAAGEGGPPRPRAQGGASLDVAFTRAQPVTHGAPARENVRMVAVPAAGGFFVLENDWPLGASPDPAFEAFRASFRPGGR